MGDYLNHLTGRVSGVQAAVRPRLPSWFEPPRALATTRLSYIFPSQRTEREETQPIDDFSSTVGTPMLRVLTKQEKPVTAPIAITFREHDQRSHKPDSQPVSVRLPTESPPIVRTRHARESMRDEEKKEHENRDEGSTQELRPAAHSLHPRSSGEAELLPARREIKKPVARRPDPDADATQRETLSRAPQRPRVQAREVVPPAHKHAIEKSSVQPGPVRPAESIQNASNLIPVRAARQTPVVVRAEPSEDSSPAVQVVIGRVIVQAIAPPPALVTQAPRMQTPRLSLEEYLKQREGRA